jgi:hypothetical protein
MKIAIFRAKAVLIFVAHQIVGTWGIAFLAAFGLFAVFDAMPAGWKPSIHIVHRVLTENPFYPVQIITGLYFGWLLGRRFQHKTMVWIWIVPLVALCYAFTVGFVLIPAWTSVLARPTTIESKLSHYFGWGCQPRGRCLDQLLITMPFYTSVAYSLGALLARNIFKKQDRFNQVHEAVSFDQNDSSRVSTNKKLN